MSCQCAANETEPFPSKGDPYGGVSVAVHDVAACETVESFRSRLEVSLSSWRSSGRRGVWLQIPATHASFIPAAQAMGFEYHHAEPDYLMMCAWLGAGASTLPANASHSVGVGIVCLNESGELLVVQEASGPAANRKGGFWKVPTGLVNAGEELAAGAVREMKEETGIDVDFVKVLAFRDLQAAMHGKGNLYFVTLCTVREGSPTEIRMQAEELAAARWMPIDVFLSLPYYQGTGAYAELNRATVAAALDSSQGMQRLRLAVQPDNPKRGHATIYTPCAKL